MPRGRCAPLGLSPHTNERTHTGSLSPRSCRRRFAPSPWPRRSGLPARALVCLLRRLEFDFVKLLFWSNWSFR